MFGIKKKWTSSEIAIAFLNVLGDEDDRHYERLKATVLELSQNHPGASKSFEQAFRDAPFPHMAYNGAVAAESMLAVKNLYPKSSDRIYREIYTKLREICSAKTEWFPDYTFGMLADAQQNLANADSIIASRMLQKMNLHLDPVREDVLDNTVVMQFIIECIVYHPITGFWKDMSGQVRIIDS